MRLRASIAAVLLATAGCAPVTQAPEVDPESAKAEVKKQLEIRVELYVADLRRLNAVAFRILSANAELCREKKKSAHAFGFKVGNAFSFPRDYESGARRIIGGGGAVRVVAVAPGSPADRAGLREGDAIVALNGIVAPRGENEDATRDFVNLLSLQAKSGNPVLFGVRRDRADMELFAQPAETCDYADYVAAGDIINAFADGKAIHVTRGMMRFAGTDEELATVVGHELAHNLMSHIDTKEANALIGSVVDLLFALGTGVRTGGAFGDIGRQTYSQEFETEADYVGLYLMARAGYDIKGTPNFWRRMGTEGPSAIRTDHASSHPAAPYRYVSLEKTVAEIARKRAGGLPLRPEMKKAD